MNTPASARTKEESFASFMKRLARYKHVRKMLTASNPDLPRWIYDNLVKSKK